MRFVFVCYCATSQLAIKSSCNLSILQHSLLPHELNLSWMSKDKPLFWYPLYIPLWIHQSSQRQGCQKSKTFSVSWFHFSTLHKLWSCRPVRWWCPWRLARSLFVQLISGLCLCQRMLTLLGNPVWYWGVWQDQDGKCNWWNYFIHVTDLSHHIRL